MQRNRGAAIYPFRNQDFEQTRDWCLMRGYLFEDPYFKLDYNYEWNRPWEISRNPQLFVGGITRFDVNQGELGDCWMLASIAALGVYPDLVKRIVPSDQSFTDNYAGIFHFRLWRFGKWYDVVIDDRLPTHNGQLVYTKSGSRNEFWTALLEKAYCKIMGGYYKVADAGNLCEALEDFSGGVVEQFCLANAPRNFEDILLKTVQRSSLVGCFLEDIPGSSESKTPGGIVRGHSYSITGSVRLNLPDYGNITLIRVRNPWGQFEWTGPWSDKSREWNSVPYSTKQEIGLIKRDDGEFWMSFSDFMSNFEWVDMCHLSPEVFSDAYGHLTNVAAWSLTMIRGNWVRGVSAGGARNLLKNPHMKFSLSEADDDNYDGRCGVLIALLQKQRSVDDYFEIGYKVYQLRDFNDDMETNNFFSYNQPVAVIPTKRVREVAGRFNLEPGAYAVVPFTYEAGKEAEFLLRIYSEKSTGVDQSDQRIGLSPADVRASVVPPMKITKRGLVDEISDDGLREYFDKVSGEDKEVDWKELKNVLDFAMKKNTSPSQPTEERSWSHFLVDAAQTVYHMIVGSSAKLNAFKTIGPEGFSNDLCRSMVALLDVDHSGKLGFNEFQDLWNEINKWKLIYEQFSEDSDGILNSSGLKEALESAGFHFNRQILSDVVHRYSTKDGKITFDDFLHCSIKIKSMAEFFKSKDKNDTHIAEFTLEEFMDKTLYS